MHGITIYELFYIDHQQLQARFISETSVLQFIRVRIRAILQSRDCGNSAQLNWSLHRRVDVSSVSSPRWICRTYPFFLNFLRPSLSLSRFVASLSGSFLERPDLLIPYMSGFSSHSRLDSCLTLSFASVLWFEPLLWKLSLCAAGASDFSDFSESEPDPEPEPLEELESLR